MQTSRVAGGRARWRHWRWRVTISACSAWSLTWTSSLPSGSSPGSPATTRPTQGGTGPSSSSWWRSSTTPTRPAPARADGARPLLRPAPAAALPAPAASTVEDADDLVVLHDHRRAVLVRRHLSATPSSGARARPRTPWSTWPPRRPPPIDVAGSRSGAGRTVSMPTSLPPSSTGSAGSCGRASACAPSRGLVAFDQ